MLEAAHSVRLTDMSRALAFPTSALGVERDSNTGARMGRNKLRPRQEAAAIKSPYNMRLVDDCSVDRGFGMGRPRVAPCEECAPSFCVAI